MIPPDSSVLLFTVLLAAALFGVYGQRKGWFKRISGVLVTILLMALLATFDVVPSASDPDVEVPVYRFIFSYFVPVAIPLLLFQVQLGRVVREGGRLLVLFLIGSLGVVAGAVVAYLIVAPGPEMYKVAGVFIGTYTGGSVNFMAVAATLDFLDSPLFASVIAVDNVFTNFYIMALFALPSLHVFARWFTKWEEPSNVDVSRLHDTASASLESITACLLIAVGTAAASGLLAPFVERLLRTEVDLTILLITILILVAANVFPVAMSYLSAVAFDLGMFLLYLFLGVIGAASDLGVMLGAAPGIILFATIVLVTHFAVILTAGRIMGYSLQEILLASCANAAGPSVTAPMAVTFNMRSVVTAAVLVAIMGYVVGTFLGVGTGLVLAPG